MTEQGGTHGAVEQVRGRRRRASTGRPGREVRPKSITIDVHSHVGVPRAAEFVKPHLDADGHAAGALRQRRDQGAQPEAGGRHRRAREPGAAARRSRCHGPRHAGDQAAAAAVLLRRAARHRGARRRRWSTTASPSSSPASRTGSKGFGTRADARRQRGRQGARALRHQARLQGRAGAHQRQRPRAVRPRLRAVLEEGRGARRARRHPPQRLHAGRAPVALLLQQRDRQSARDDHRAALPDLRRRAGAASQPQDPGRARRRLSRELLGPHRPRLGRALRLARRPAAPADELPQEASTSTRSCSRPHQLQELVRLYGADHILMGTDYPFDMARLRPRRPCLQRPASTRPPSPRICGGNAKRLLGL